jgi:hypothetical protein
LILGALAFSCGKSQNAVILSEAKNLSLFVLCTEIEERFFAALKMTEQDSFFAIHLDGHP